MNLLFASEEERLALIKFQTLNTSTISEISIVSVVRLPFVITDVIDSLRPTIDRISNRAGNNFDGVSKLGSVETMKKKNLLNEG